MKRILIIDENLPYLLNHINYPVGGASVQTKNWMIGFENLNYYPIICSNKIINNKSEYNIINPTNSRKKGTILFYLALLKNYNLILKLYRPEFIYISIPCWINIFVLINAKFLRIKVIQRISNDNFVDSNAKTRFQNSVKYLIFKLSLKLTPFFLCQNDYQLDRLKLKYPNKIIKKAYNPFHLGHLINGELTERNYVAWIGLFQKQKNIPELLFLVSQLPSIKFKIAGKPLNNIDNETQNALNELRLYPNVEFVGLLSRDDIFVFLSNAFALINTSHIEGFSNTYLEAFSVGTPVITRLATDPDGIISKYKLGISVNNYTEMPKAVIDLINKKTDHRHIRNYLTIYHNPIELAERIKKLIHIW